MEERGVEAPAGQPIPEMDPRAGRTHKRWRDGQAEAEKVKRARRPTDAVVLTTPGEEDAIVTPGVRAAKQAAVHDRVSGMLPERLEARIDPPQAPPVRVG
eukprot:6048690-Prorocentrum_lima.AAC.1